MVCIYRPTYLSTESIYRHMYIICIDRWNAMHIPGVTVSEESYQLISVSCSQSTLSSETSSNHDPHLDTLSLSSPIIRFTRIPMETSCDLAWKLLSSFPNNQTTSENKKQKVRPLHFWNLGVVFWNQNAEDLATKMKLSTHWIRWKGPILLMVQKSQTTTWDGAKTL